MSERITFGNCIRVLTCRGCGHSWGVGVLVVRAGLSTPCRACGLRTLARGERDTSRPTRKARAPRIAPASVQTVAPSEWVRMASALPPSSADSSTLDRIAECLRISRIAWPCAERERGQPGGRLGASEDLLLALRDIVRGTGREVGS